MSLERKKPLNPGKGLARRTPLRSVPTQQRAPKPPKPREPRTRKSAEDAGSSVPQKLRDMVIERAGFACDRCARSLIGRPYSLQHRRARGAGGRRNAHTPANLIVLCGSATTPGSCHDRVEHHAREEAYAHGFAIRGEARRPEEVPIFWHLRIWFIPGDGLWIPAQPPEQLAA